MDHRITIHMVNYVPEVLDVFRMAELAFASLWNQSIN
jgi:hypothetical protein